MTVTAVSVVFTREAIYQMGVAPFMAVIAASTERDVWDLAEDTLVFSLTESDWMWLLLQHPELTVSGWYPAPKTTQDLQEITRTHHP